MHTAKEEKTTFQFNSDLSGDLYINNYSALSEGKSDEHSHIELPAKDVILFVIDRLSDRAKTRMEHILDDKQRIRNQERDLRNCMDSILALARLSEEFEDDTDDDM